MSVNVVLNTLVPSSAPVISVASSNCVRLDLPWLLAFILGAGVGLGSVSSFLVGSGRVVVVGTATAHQMRRKRKLCTVFNPTEGFQGRNLHRWHTILARHCCCLAAVASRGPPTARTAAGRSAHHGQLLFAFTKMDRVNSIQPTNT